MFRALYTGFDLHAIGGTYLAIPKGTPCYAAPTLAEVARQISGCAYPGPAPGERARPGNLAEPGA